MFVEYFVDSYHRCIFYVGVGVAVVDCSKEKFPWKQTDAK